MANISSTIQTTTISAAVAALLQAGPALAQESGFTLEEVVVTARKRDESLQDVPMAVAAFNNRQLQEAGVNDITDLARLTPNITLNETNGLVGGALQVFVRGIGNDPGFDQGVGIYVDDVYLNRASGSILDVYDVQRIEVLKGPQGNLYGRNTIGGAIKYVTRNPGDELAADVEVKVGEDDLYQLKGSVSGPLIDSSLYGGFGFMYKERDGYQTNQFDGDEYGSVDTQAVRGTLLWVPRDNLEFKLHVDYSKDQADPAVPTRVAVDEEAMDNFNFVLTGADLFFGPGTSLVTIPNDTSLPADIDDVNTAYINTPTGGYDDYEIESTTASLALTWDINDEWALKSVTAGRWLDNNLPFDFDGSDQRFINLTDYRESEDYSQEFQFNYTGDTVKAVLGLYYLDGSRELSDPVTTEQTVRLRLFTENYETTFVDDRDEESASIYGTIDWDFSENWQLSLGGRYTRDEKKQKKRSTVTLRGYAAAMVPFAPGAIFPIAPGMEAQVEASPLFGGWLPGFSQFFEVTTPASEDADENWTEFTPSAKLSYHVHEDMMVYGGIATGFKSGGFPSSGTVSEPQPYDPETVNTYSLGLKTTLLDGSLRLNAEAFYNDYTDKQLDTIELEDNGSLVQTVDNVGKVTTSGAEVEIAWLPPVEGLTINFNVGYLDSDIDEFLTTDEQGNKIDVADDFELGYAPEWTVQGRVSQDLTIRDWGTLTLAVDATYRDEMFVDSPIDITSEIQKSVFSEDHTIWNAMIAFRSADERWRFALEGKNLDDERVLVNSFQIVDDWIIGGYNQPRRWTFSIGYTY